MSFSATITSIEGGYPSSPASRVDTSRRDVVSIPDGGFASIALYDGQGVCVYAKTLTGDFHAEIRNDLPVTPIMVTASPAAPTAS